MEQPLTWEQKLEALQSLGEATLHMRKPGDWFVNHRGVYIYDAEHPNIISGTYGNGRSPIEAVEKHWLIFAGAQGKKSVAAETDAGSTKKHLYRWNGFMWKEFAS